jgi:hypothetical protein
MGFVVGGVVGRLAMRLIAIGQHRVPMLSIRGTMEVLLFATALGAGVGLLYVFVRRFIPGRGAVRGLLYSLALQLIGAVIGFPLPMRPPSGGFTWPDVLPRVVFAALIFLAGPVLEWLVGRKQSFL